MLSIETGKEVTPEDWFLSGVFFALFNYISFFHSNR